jgi:phytoene/squalene synthetase
MDRQRKEFLNLFNRIDFEKIKDHPNILIAASFWDDERYNAARTFYRFMRAVDDLIDNHKTEHLRFSEDEKKQYILDVQQWLDTIRNSTEGNSLYQELTETIVRFHIPLWPLEAFAKSMVYDIHYDGFSTIQQFLDYAGGASVAPASIFVHLCGLREDNGQYLPPPFDVREAAIPCAIFSYLVHIIRDFQKDQFNNLNYFADDVLEKNGLDRQDLKRIAEKGDIPHGFRKVIKEYHDLAEQYRLKTCNMIQTIWPYLGPRYRLSLEVIFNLYLMAFERIDPGDGNFTTIELNPTASEMRSRVLETVEKFQENHSNCVKN